MYRVRFRWYDEGNWTCIDAYVIANNAADVLIQFCSKHPEELVGEYSIEKQTTECIVSINYNK